MRETPYEAAEHALGIFADLVAAAERGAVPTAAALIRGVDVRNPQGCVLDAAAYLRAVAHEGKVAHARRVSIAVWTLRSIAPWWRRETETEREDG